MPSRSGLKIRGACPRLHIVNRTTRWLLPAVLALLVLVALAGALIH